jgi:hypothetical protein
MSVAANTSNHNLFDFFKSSAVRTGIYAGTCLSLVFASWVVIANRVPILEPFATDRNVAATVLLLLFACVPLIRFFRSPADMLASGILAWGLLALSFWALCIAFPMLEENFTAFHVFALGAVTYLTLATLSWIGTIIWRVRAIGSTHVRH